MLQKFNLALIPDNHEKLIIHQAQILSDIADNYLLGEQSHPHITLHHFEAHESELESIWKNIHYKSKLSLMFNEISLISFDNSTFWISLMPDLRAILTEMHIELAPLVNKKINKNFDPHMTLLNSKNRDYAAIADDVLKGCLPVEDSFSLVIGTSDDAGQLTKIIFQAD